MVTSDGEQTLAGDERNISNGNFQERWILREGLTPCTATRVWIISFKKETGIRIGMEGPDLQNQEQKRIHICPNDLRAGSSKSCPQLLFLDRVSAAGT